MSSKPILFSADMVRALLEGRKTQTRRVIKPQPPQSSGKYKVIPRHQDDESASLILIQEKVENTVINPPYKKGDLLWVREAFYFDTSFYKPTKEHLSDIYYRADGECCEQIPECACSEIGKPKWKPSIFLPHWASRITLKVKNIRIERLNEISSSDAIDEGISVIYCGERELYKNYQTGKGTVYATQSFGTLWQSIHGCESWKNNPLVWVIEFDAYLGNIDDDPNMWQILDGIPF